jgi:hypothetical protein
MGTATTETHYSLPYSIQEQTMVEEGMSSLKTNTVERQAAIRNLLNNVDLSTKDADTAFLIELVGGVLGFMGLGYIYSGLTNTGIVRLGLWLVVSFVSWSIIGCLSFVGIGLCLIPVPIIAQIALAYFSANDLKQTMNAAKAGGTGFSTPTPGGYIESPTPMSSSSDSVFNTPSTPAPAPRPTSGDSLFTTPSTPEPAPWKNDSDSLFSSPDAPESASNDGDDFNADDLTKKV